MALCSDVTLVWVIILASNWLLCLDSLLIIPFHNCWSYFHKSLCLETFMAPSDLWHKGLTSQCIIQNFTIWPQPNYCKLLAHHSLCYCPYAPGTLGYLVFPEPTLPFGSSYFFLNYLFPTSSLRNPLYASKPARLLFSWHFSQFPPAR